MDRQQYRGKYSYASIAFLKPFLFLLIIQLPLAFQFSITLSFQYKPQNLHTENHPLTLYPHHLPLLSYRMHPLLLLLLP